MGTREVDRTLKTSMCNERSEGAACLAPRFETNTMCTWLKCTRGISIWYALFMVLLNMPTLRGECPNPRYAGSTMWSGITCVAVDGSYAYCGTRYGFQILSLEINQPPQILSRLYLPNERLRKVVTSGEVCYCIALDSSLVVIDATNPTNPTVCTRLQLHDVPNNIALRGSRAIITSSSGFLEIIDISDPCAPVLLGSNLTGLRITAMAALDDYLLVGTGTDCRMAVMNITDPSSPTIVGSYHTTGGDKYRPAYVADLAVDGVYAITVVNGIGIDIVDVSNPKRPSRVSGLEINGDPWLAAIVGDKAYVLNGSPLSGGLVAVDLTDPRNPEVLSTFVTPYSSQGLCVKDSHVYLCDASEGLQIIDVSNTSSMFESGRWTPGTVGAICTIGNAKVAVAFGNWLRILDMRDPNEPTTISELELAGDVRSIASSKRGLFCCMNKSDLVRIDLTNVDSPEVAATYKLPLTGLSIECKNDSILVANGAGEVLILEQPSVDSVQVLGVLELPCASAGIQIEGELAYVIDFQGNLRIFNVGATEPSLVGEVKTGLKPASECQLDNGFIYAVGPGKIVIVDVRDAANPQVCSVTGTLGSGQYIAIGTGKLYLADGAALATFEMAEDDAPK